MYEGNGICSTSTDCSDNFGHSQAQSRAECCAGGGVAYNIDGSCVDLMCKLYHL